MSWARRARVVAALLCCTSVLVVTDSRPAAAAAGRIRGEGSTYVALAMQQWITDASNLGIKVDYNPSGSPAGLGQFAAGLSDFAGTEAEFSGLTASGGGTGGAEERRGYQYVPDVAGAIAVMYNVNNAAGGSVDYLQLSPVTVARIFMGKITSWADPQIAADNAKANLRLPDEPITVVYRTGQSGTTALFYDFVANSAPAEFEEWRVRNQLPDNKTARIINLEKNGGNFAPNTLGKGSSDLIAQHVGGSTGKWSIGYDEFGYAKVYGVQAARIRNVAGEWQLPYAANITAALEGAQLRPDLTQELSAVYANPDPLAYPISAYSYLVTQCSPRADRPTCQGPYADGGTAQTLAQWMRMIACDGQIQMARIGYSPLPPDLSQELENSVARMMGEEPRRLNAGNCSNPRFRGNISDVPGAVAPKNKVDEIVRQREAARQGEGGGTQGSAGAAGGTDSSTATDSTAVGDESESAAARTGRVGGGSKSFRAPAPVEYRRPLDLALSLLPLMALLAIVVVPPLALGGQALLRRQGRPPKKRPSA